jgi:hypothetical protein
MDASGTRSGGCRAEDSGHADEENLFSRKQAGNKAAEQDRKCRLSLALKTSSLTLQFNALKVPDSLRRMSTIVGPTLTSRQNF